MRHRLRKKRHIAYKATHIVSVYTSVYPFSINFYNTVFEYRQVDFRCSAVVAVESVFFHALICICVRLYFTRIIIITVDVYKHTHLTRTSVAL